MRPLTWGRISATRKADVRPGNSVVSTTRSAWTVTNATSGEPAGGGAGCDPQPARRSPAITAAAAITRFSQYLLGINSLLAPRSNGAQNITDQKIVKYLNVYL